VGVTMTVRVRVRVRVRIRVRIRIRMRIRVRARARARARARVRVRVRICEILCKIFRILITIFESFSNSFVGFLRVGDEGLNMLSGSWLLPLNGEPIRIEFYIEQCECFSLI
jgi:hypothetical protein